MTDPLVRESGSRVLNERSELSKDKFSVDPHPKGIGHSRKITMVSVLGEERPPGVQLRVLMSQSDSSTGRRFILGLSARGILVVRRVKHSVAYLYIKIYTYIR